MGSRVRGAAAREVFSRLGPRAKIFAIIGVVLLIGLFVLDFFVLKGERVASGSVKMGDKEDYMVIPVTEQFEDHYVTIRSGGSGSRKREYRLSIRLVDPVGNELYSDSEILSSNKTRGFTFEPFEVGEHRLYVDHHGILSGTSRSAKVQVYINDRRFISKLFD